MVVLNGLVLTMSVKEQAIATNREILTSRGNILCFLYHLGTAQMQYVSRVFASNHY